MANQKTIEFILNKINKSAGWIVRYNTFIMACGGDKQKALEVMADNLDMFYEDFFDKHKIELTRFE